MTVARTESGRESCNSRDGHSGISRNSTKQRVGIASKLEKGMTRNANLTSQSQVTPIIDIESIRKSKWREGRDEVILVGSPNNFVHERDGNSATTSTIDAILAHIEHTKLQSEPESALVPAEGSHRLTGFIDNLSKAAADEMDRIERASSDYRY